MKVFFLHNLYAFYEVHKNVDCKNVKIATIFCLYQIMMVLFQPQFVFKIFSIENFKDFSFLIFLCTCIISTSWARKSIWGSIKLKNIYASFRFHYFVIFLFFSPTNTKIQENYTVPLWETRHKIFSSHIHQSTRLSPKHPDPYPCCSGTILVYTEMFIDTQS